ncbi:MAG: hypothetical protein ACRD29_22370 [Acidimicrobiales bacterium]
MRGERFVVLGLAHARSAWFRDVARWATSAAIPVEFVQCLSAEELRARLGSGRAFSAVLVDGGLPGVDRDLLDVARHVGSAVLVVDGRRGEHDWHALGASAVLLPDFDRTDLLEALETYAARITRGDAVTLAPAAAPSAWRAPLIGVTGARGAGVSTAAMALAQGLAADARHGGLVLLADLALDAELAALHDAKDVVPGVQELVDSHRGGHPSAEEIRTLTFHVPVRGYHLLLGLRRHRDWTAIRPRAFDAALEGLRRSFSAVVADLDPDVEGEAQCGSVDVEERNLMARTVTSTSDVVVAVGQARVKGLLSLVRVLVGLVDHGVHPARIVPMLNQAPRSPARRAELTKTLSLLTAPITGSEVFAAPIYLPERRHLDTTIRDVAHLPAPLVSPIVGAVGAMLHRSIGGVAPSEPEPVPVAPGSLGTWTTTEELAQ